MSLNRSIWTIFQSILIDYAYGPSCDSMPKTQTGTHICQKIFHCNLIANKIPWKPLPTFDWDFSILLKLKNAHAIYAIANFKVIAIRRMIDCLIPLRNGEPNSECCIEIRELNTCFTFFSKDHRERPKVQLWSIQVTGAFKTHVCPIPHKLNFLTGIIWLRTRNFHVHDGTSQKSGINPPADP